MQGVHFLFKGSGCIICVPVKWIRVDEPKVKLYVHTQLYLQLDQFEWAKSSFQRLFLEQMDLRTTITTGDIDEEHLIRLPACGREDVKLPVADVYPRVGDECRQRPSVSIGPEWGTKYRGLTVRNKKCSCWSVYLLSVEYGSKVAACTVTFRIASESSGKPFPPAPSARSIRYPIPSQEDGNALVTPLVLQVSMGGSDHATARLLIVGHPTLVKYDLGNTLTVPKSSAIVYRKTHGSDPLVEKNVARVTSNARLEFTH
ncbi:hypothetical protein EVAR_4534_1 [Eumeta japonica]|uniref:Uncharacterized protein n=1 Tax=Eumeta variegata TaxID=151549 RepID=A0A4C1SW17_EUMVA|nr:hypothetical protein EVAR_4534_1 [Eumeta japonica]